MLMFILLVILLALVGLAAVPLMLGVVPPNPYYGFPARSSAKHPELWTQVNKFGGRAVVVAVVIAIAGLMYWDGTWLRSGILKIVFVLVVLGLAGGATMLYACKVGA